MTALPSTEEQLADYIYSAQNWTDAKEVAAHLWPALVPRCEVQTGAVTEKAIHDAIANAFSNGVVTYSAVRQAAKDVLALTSSAAQALWMPIETAPNHGEVLLWWKHAGVGVGSWDDEGGGWRCEGDECVPKNQSDCTHWMPKPAGPSMPSAAQASPQTCSRCMGSGYSNHPDSGEICQACGGQGVELPSAEQRCPECEANGLCARHAVPSTHQAGPHE